MFVDVSFPSRENGMQVRIFDTKGTLVPDVGPFVHENMFTPAADETALDTKSSVETLLVASPRGCVTAVEPFGSDIGAGAGAGTNAKFANPIA